MTENTGTARRTMSAASTSKSDLKILSANIRGFRTNVGDLTHSFVLKYKPDIVATVETFLNESVPQNFGKIQGYSTWTRRDRVGRNFGGIAVCFRSGLQVQELNVETHDDLEIKFLKLCNPTSGPVLVCVCYRPQWQGSRPISFLQENLDALLVDHSCHNVIVVGDLNQHLVSTAFNDFLATHGLENHVTFATHISGSSLDPVITDFPVANVQCESVGSIGSSDHYAVLSTIRLQGMYDEGMSRPLWQWERGEWQKMREILSNMSFEPMLVGDVDLQADKITNILSELQEKYVPHKTYTAKPTDQPWFGPRCRAAADAKRDAWRAYKRNSTEANRQLHHIRCAQMKSTQKWAISRWEDNLRKEILSSSAGCSKWWKSIKKHQDSSADQVIPPLNHSGGVCTSAQDKAELLAKYFADKMSVPDADQSTHDTMNLTEKQLNSFNITSQSVLKELKSLDTSKATGPDGVSPHILKNCAQQLAAPLAALFTNCLKQKRWPKLWKKASVVAVHKKDSKNEVKNYRPISLLSVIGKIYERLIAAEVTRF